MFKLKALSPTSVGIVSTRDAPRTLRVIEVIGLKEGQALPQL
jgi:hypothetical protein